MVNLIKSIAETLGFLLSLLFPSSFCEAADAFVSHIYTGYYKRRFRHFGRGSVIARKAKHLRMLECVSVGREVQIEREVCLTVWTAGDTGHAGSITIGDNCNLGARNHITSCNSITIGSGLLTGSDVLITDNAHGRADRASLALPPVEREVVSKGPVRIGDNVWLGNHVCVMPGVTIGDGAVVGANSIVTHDIPPYTVCAGIPAQPLRKAEP